MKDYQKIAEEGAKKWFTFLMTEFGRTIPVSSIMATSRKCYRIELKAIIAANPMEVHPLPVDSQGRSAFTVDCNKEHYEKILKELDKL
ncbi:hypothetical protein FGF1_03640 [Flavobacteriaceae bacterium GF1]